MKKYLYLSEHWMAENWVNGGVVPLFAASKYRKQDRIEIYTPDENLIDNSTHPVESFRKFGIYIDDTSTIILDNSTIGGKLYPGQVRLERRVEDALVLCMANRLSNYIAKGLKKVACVEIQDVFLLKSALDEQIGTVGIMGPCQYTSGHNRNHFLKSDLDGWQDEFRIIWPGIDSTDVTVPAGNAIKKWIRGMI
ncbi:hypothetical protein [Citrobacter freundii]|uniref:hypothetical protein n=1 Tax=Citrobacter freundii TaxID=546 RepID=UPI0018FFADCA|nr:hypothetical protein [Citrobacter freundii]MBJ9313103.1 hypothetical protein [Citrobacter freundii]HEI8943222.1 hypothetical protein [Citrobacter freundii]HEJ0170265.1 hypothetical protein [Citrobacter freundii]